MLIPFDFGIVSKVSLFPVIEEGINVKEIHLNQKQLFFSLYSERQTIKSELTF